jgi:hypothetical protein
LNKHLDAAVEGRFGGGLKAHLLTLWASPLLIRIHYRSMNKEMVAETSCDGQLRPGIALFSRRRRRGPKVDAATTPAESETHRQQFCLKQDVYSVKP